MAHKHDKIIANYKSIGDLSSILSNSREDYILDHLNIHLHKGQLKLLEKIKKEQKPHHKAIRMKKYKELMNNDEATPEHFELHQKIFINKIKKLENKGLIKADFEVDLLPYEVEFTEKGKEILNEIDVLKQKWEDEIFKDFEDKDKLLTYLQQVAPKAAKISYARIKKQKGVY
ncbi:helix-turn-helix domain-containing protein [Methanosphaera cuniculi]|uniref:HTH marR-type domain-containing protein n=1 Tax=Methanosphaera cuniculi TaxID=1077256 RepID=A0A2A2HB81_9EURY|nr:hypothetical protein [Methanosphaera cuniculi]PAV06615.1 hypothetical protein ASJ82_04080 [Methanosphaera cuniculi]PWL07803.1 hypothetical protein MSCUN_13340 [Methanosphaera cuniculi]